jgi:Zinc dependent phospholipase C
VLPSRESRRRLICSALITCRRVQFFSADRWRALRGAILVLLLFQATLGSTSAYSVLTHEAVIDSAWDPVIRPLLLKRFPDATPEDLKNAHAYVYGGSIIQDLGYYPFGSKFFSNLVHYVRSADFVTALIRDSSDLNEYAFAIGAVAHYVGDNNGHPIAVNVSVPMLYPKLRRKYGPVVVYDEDPAAHLKTEFGFDVLQIARGHYAPDAYRDHIGFQVSKSLLQRAFQDTYCLDLDSVFFSYDLAIGSYRRSVSTVIPKMTKVAWQIKKDQIQKEIPGATRRTFVYSLSRSSYNKNWGHQYQEPGLGTKILAFLISLIPKVGPFSALSFRTPTPQSEKLFMDSFNATLQNYSKAVPEAASFQTDAIHNDNLDTGTVTGPGEYPLADQTYAELVERLQKAHFAGVSPELRSDLLGYYRDLNAPFATKKNKKEWSKLVQDVNELNATPSRAVPAQPETHTPNP